MAIADTQGLDAVSMKSVAAAVGFTTMSLYRDVASKDELFAVMLDEAFGPPDLEYAPDDDWRARLTACRAGRAGYPAGSLPRAHRPAHRPRAFPKLAAAGPEALNDDDDHFYQEEFDRGLGLLLDGTAALIARQG